MSRLTESAARVFNVLRKDLRLGPRSPLVLWAVVLPVVLTVLVRGVFAGLLAPQPRLGVVDAGQSALVTSLAGVVDIETVRVAAAETLQSQVAAGDLDAGLVLPAGFDEAVLGGEQPPLPLLIGGESLASTRAVVIGTLLGLVRDLSGAGASVDVEVVELGEPGLALDVRLLPLLVIIAVAIAGGMVPAASLVDEKQRRTLPALLVTPLSTAEVLLAKGLLGWLLAMATGAATLALNDAFGAAPGATMLALGLGAAMMAEVGLLLGTWARRTDTLFAAWKVGALALIYPAAVFVFPGMPAWVAQAAPTFYVLRPIYALSVEGKAVAAVTSDLAVAAVICLVLLPLVGLAGRRMAAGPRYGRIGTGAG